MIRCDGQYNYILKENTLDGAAVWTSTVDHLTVVRIPVVGAVGGAICARLRPVVAFIAEK